MNTVQKMAGKCSTKQDGEATREEVPGLIVTYREEEITALNRKTTCPLKTQKRVLVPPYAACNCGT